LFPYILEELDQHDREIFRQVEASVGKISLAADHLDFEISCHNLCRALAKIHNLEVVDGYFTAGFCHSWLTTDSGAIIDPYPPLIVCGPIMIPKRKKPYPTPWKNIYLPADIQLNTGKINSQAETIRQFIVS
jgi:hypothetical protein